MGEEYGVIKSGAEETNKNERGIKKKRGWVLTMNLSCFRILPWAFIIISEFSIFIQYIKYHLFSIKGYDTAFQFRSEVKYQCKQTGIKSENTDGKGDANNTFNGLRTMEEL